MKLLEMQTTTTNEARLEQFRNEMEEVISEHKKTGVSARGEEVFSWMENWFTRNEKPTPVCFSTTK